MIINNATTCHDAQNPKGATKKMTWINHATPSGFGGLACLFAATFISPLRGYSLLGMPATSAPLGGVQALNVFFNSTTRYFLSPWAL
jgi:hypothetical protein